MFERAQDRWFAPLGFGLAAAIFALDQLTKYWILEIVDLDAGGVGNSIDLSAFFDLTFVLNRGVSFGLFQADSLVGRSILIGFSVIVALILIWGLIGPRTFKGLGLKFRPGPFRPGSRLQAAAFGVIIGGALGNAIDRALYGAVVDFLDFSGLFFPWVFNIADVAINVGVGLLLLDLILNGGRDR
jgi:signal peptidase II